MTGPCTADSIKHQAMYPIRKLEAVQSSVQSACCGQAYVKKCAGSATRPCARTSLTPAGSGRRSPQAPNVAIGQVMPSVSDGTSFKASLCCVQDQTPIWYRMSAAVIESLHTIVTVSTLNSIGSAFHSIRLSGWVGNGIKVGTPCSAPADHQSGGE